MSYRVGALSKNEKAYILEQAGKQTVAQIASYLKRSEDTVQKYIDKHYRGVPFGGGSTPDELKMIRQELRASTEWDRLKAEFEPDEVAFFEERYVALASQFRNDLLPTEITQVMHAIKVEILMSRNLRNKREARNQADRLSDAIQKMVRDLGGGPEGMDRADRDRLVALEQQLASSLASQQGLTTEYDKLANLHSDYLKTLKATRDQRVKDVENSKQNFLGVVKLFQEREIAQREGRQAELVKLAASQEYKRLGRVHTYGDGNQDRPILSADTVGEAEGDE